MAVVSDLNNGMATDHVINGGEEVGQMSEGSRRTLSFEFRVVRTNVIIVGAGL